MLNAFLNLGFVVLVLGLALYFLKRMNKKKKNFKGQPDLQIVSKLSLQAKNHLYIVKADDKTLLIGATDHNITTLADLSDRSIENINLMNKLNSQETLLLKNSKTKTLPKQKIEENPSNSLSFKTFLKSAFTKTN